MAKYKVLVEGEFDGQKAGVNDIIELEKEVAEHFVGVSKLEVAEEGADLTAKGDAAEGKGDAGATAGGADTAGQAGAASEGDAKASGDGSGAMGGATEGSTAKVGDACIMPDGNAGTMQDDPANPGTLTCTVDNSAGGAEQ